MKIAYRVRRLVLSMVMALSFPVETSRSQAALRVERIAAIVKPATPRASPSARPHPVLSDSDPPTALSRGGQSPAPALVRSAHPPRKRND